MTAVLIKEGLLTLEEIFPHLVPEAAVMKAAHTAKVEAAKSKAVKKLAVEETIQANKLKHAAATQEGSQNQKLGLCNASLLIHDWQTANQIIEQLPPFAATAWPPLRKRLCTVAQAVLEPLYRKVTPSFTKPSADLSTWIKGLDVCGDYQDMPVLLFPILKRLGMYASTDVILLTKVLRVMKACFAESKERGDEELTLQAEVEDVFKYVIMPSISLIDPGNAALSMEAWAVLDLMPYQARYRLYFVWKNKSEKLHPDVLLAQKMATKETVFILKRLTKENWKAHGRTIGKLTHSNPGAVFDKILGLLQEDGYNNLIGPIVDALKYLSPLSKDMLAYCMVEAISNPKKQRLKEGDITLQQWLQTLSNFCAQVFKMFPIDMQGVLQ